MKRVFKWVGGTAIVLLLLAPTTPNCTGEGGLVADNGDLSFYQQALPKLLGRRAKGSLELAVLSDLSAHYGRSPVVEAVMRSPEFDEHWEHRLTQLMKLERNTGNRRQPAACYGPDAGTSQGATAALATSVLLSDATNAVAGNATMTDVIRSSLKADNLLPTYLAGLYPLAYQATGTTGAASEMGTQFSETYLGRNVSCLGCHRSEFSITNAGSSIRTWPLPVNAERSAFGTGAPGNVANGTQSLLLDPVSMAFELTRARRATTRNQNRPWGMSQECFTGILAVSAVDEPMVISPLPVLGAPTGYPACPSGTSPVAYIGANSTTDKQFAVSTNDEASGYRSFDIALFLAQAGSSSTPALSNTQVGAISWAYSTTSSATLDLCTGVATTTQANANWDETWASFTPQVADGVTLGGVTSRRVNTPMDGVCAAWARGHLTQRFGTLVSSTGVTLPKRRYLVRATFSPSSGVNAKRTLCGVARSAEGQRWNMRGGFIPLASSSVVGTASNQVPAAYLLGGTIGPELPAFTLEKALRSGAGKLEQPNWLPTPGETGTETTSWNASGAAVFPIFQAKCTGCHNSVFVPPGVPNYFALDRYEDGTYTVPGTNPATTIQQMGAFSMRWPIHDRAVTKWTHPAHVRQDGAMPPVGYADLSAGEVQVIADWVAEGSPLPVGGGQPPLAPTTQLSMLDPDSALAFMVASNVVNKVFTNVTGHPLTIANYFPRNQFQRNILWDLVQNTFLANEWSLRALLRRILVSDFFNREPPAATTPGFTPYGLFAYLNPWAEDVASTSWNEGWNSGGDAVHRHDVSTIINSTGRILNSGRYKRDFPFEQASSLTYPATTLASRLGEQFGDIVTGTDGWPLDAHLEWEDTVGLASPAVSGSLAASQWPDRLAAAMPPYVSASDVALAVKDWVLQEPFWESEDERLAAAGFFGDPVVNASVFDPYTDTPAVRASLAANIRKYAGVLLRSPQFLLAGLPAPRSHWETWDAQGRPVPNIRVCNAADGACSYQELCNEHLARVQPSSLRAQCTCTAVGVSCLTPGGGGGPSDPVGPDVGLSGICTKGDCGWASAPGLDGCFAGFSESSLDVCGNRPPASASICRDRIRLCDTTCERELGCCEKKPIKEGGDGVIVVRGENAAVKRAERALILKSSGTAFEQLTTGTVLATGDVLEVYAGGHLEFGTSEMNWSTPKGGAKSSRQNTSGGGDVLVDAAGRGDARTVDRQLRQRTNVDSTNSFGETALMRAAARGDLTMTDRLLREGASTTITDNVGLTALGHAKLSGQAATERLIRDRGGLESPTDRCATKPLPRGEKPTRLLVGPTAPLRQLAADIQAGRVPAPTGNLAQALARDPIFRTSPEILPAQVTTAMLRSYVPNHPVLEDLSEEHAPLDGDVVVVSEQDPKTKGQ